MPWCEDCAKYWAPSAMTETGECPTCGRVIDAPQRKVTAKNLDLKKLASGLPNDADVSDDEVAPTPWHFKLLVAMFCLYMAWRIVDWIR